MRTGDQLPRRIYPIQKSAAPQGTADFHADFHNGMIQRMLPLTEEEKHAHCGYP